MSLHCNGKKIIYPYNVKKNIVPKERSSLLSPEPQFLIQVTHTCILTVSLSNFGLYGASCCCRRLKLKDKGVREQKKHEHHHAWEENVQRKYKEEY
jgi:hypothetical protein